MVGVSPNPPFTAGSSPVAAGVPLSEADADGLALLSALALVDAEASVVESESSPQADTVTISATAAPAAISQTRRGREL
jgi:hypothetical protein